MRYISTIYTDSKMNKGVMSRIIFKGIERKTAALPGNTHRWLLKIHMVILPHLSRHGSRLFNYMFKNYLIHYLHIPAGCPF